MSTHPPPPSDMAEIRIDPAVVAPATSVWMENADPDLQSKSQNFWATKSKVSHNMDFGPTVPFFPLEQGSDLVNLPLDVWNEATGIYENALVGFVFGVKPYLGKLKAFARSKWGVSNVLDVSPMSNGFFLFKFADAGTKKDVLLGGPWSFDKRPLILQEWSPYESYKCGSVAALPVWIRLPEIKAHLTDITILGLLCSGIGKPICTDNITAQGSRLNYARVCVEISDETDFVNEIDYADPFGNTYAQPVIYEWRPPRCTNCLNFGHLKDKCSESCLEDLIVQLKHHENQQKNHQVS